MLYKFLEAFILNRYKKHVFNFNNVELKYFFHSYNNFGYTERSIEIPIIKYYLEQNKHDRTLEIGNVTKHYYDLFKNFEIKDTIDKNEIAYDVINKDIYEYCNEAINSRYRKTYDFIYSISTFEHMDSDGGRNPEFKPLTEPIKNKYSSYAFRNVEMILEILLEKNGLFILTFPLGYCNDEIGHSLYNKEYQNFNLSNSKCIFLGKKSDMTWKQIDKSVDYMKSIRPCWKKKKYLCVMELRK